MFKLRKSLNNIKKVCSNNKSAFFLTQNNKVYQNEILIFEGQGIADIRICKHDFYAFGDSIHGYLGDFRNNSFAEIDFTFSSECIWRNGAIINENYRYDTLDGKIKADYFIFDLDTKQKRVLFKDLEGRITSLFDKNEKAIYLFKTTLKSLSLVTGEYDWEIDLGGKKYTHANEEYEAVITNIIAVIENHLYLWMDVDRLVVIDVSTGEIVSETFPLQNLKNNGIIKYVLLPQYRECEQAIFFFYQDFLVKIHLPTLTTTLVWQDARYNIGSGFITDEFIYFIGSYEKGSLFRDHIGVFDRTRNEIVWMQKVIELSKDSYNNLKEIQATYDKIYVLDTEGTLHIFEKE